MRAEIILKNYYKKFKRRNQLECEIEKLEKSNEHLEKYLESCSIKENLKRRIDLNNKLITEKYVEIDNIIKEISEIEHIIEDLTEEERNISKLRFEERKEYQAIACILNMSKSTVCRRIKHIIEKIDLVEKKVS
ncbi:MAG: sigma factor-like helix-turn-helix DNA-binding protein [uncultured Clostridium sp.]